MENHKIDLFVWWEKIELNDLSKDSLKLNELEIKELDVINDIKKLLIELESIEVLDNTNIPQITDVHNEVEKLFCNISLQNPWTSHYVNACLSVKSITMLWLIEMGILEITDEVNQEYIEEIKEHLEK